MAAFALGTHLSVSAQEIDSVQISRSRLQELEKAAAHAKALEAELLAAKAEIESLRARLGIARDGAVVRTPQQKNSTALIAPAAKPASTSTALPPAPRINELPPLRDGQVVAVHHLLRQFADDPTATEQYYRGRSFELRGVVSAVDKTPFLTSYRVEFQIDNCPVVLVCTVNPPERFKKVYVVHKEQAVYGGGERLVPVVLARAGTEISIKGRCGGLSSDRTKIQFNGSLVASPAP